MNVADLRLRSRVAAELDELTRFDGPLAATGERATTELPGLYHPNGLPTGMRMRLHRNIVTAYLDRQRNVPRNGQAAVVTAGPPGAGKSSVLDARVDLAAWRRIDADIVKSYLLEDAQRDHLYDDVLTQNLADGHPVLPAEMAGVVHVESVSLLGLIRRLCTARGENIVVEGTLTWTAAGQEVLDDLIAHGYSDVTILDVEVRRETAHENALTRWWEGRRLRLRTGHGLGGRFTPTAAIDRSYPDPLGAHSVCAINACALFDSPAAGEITDVALTVHDSTGEQPVVRTYRRHAGEVLPPVGQEA